MTRLFSERRVDTGRDGGGRRWWRRLHRRQARVGVLVHQARHVPRLWTFQTQPSHNTVSQLSPQPQVQQNTNGYRQLASQQPRRCGGICIHITKPLIVHLPSRRCAISWRASRACRQPGPTRRAASCAATPAEWMKRRSIQRRSAPRTIGSVSRVGGRCGGRGGGVSRRRTSCAVQPPTPTD